MGGASREHPDSGKVRRTICHERFVSHAGRCAACRIAPRLFRASTSFVGGLTPLVKWSELPREVAYLLNPPFCSSLLVSGVAGYVKVVPSGMPMALGFVLVPVVLHRPTRQSFPTTIRTSLPTWLEENPTARAVFADRAKALAPFVRDAVLFGLTQRALTVGDNGTLLPTFDERQLRAFLRTVSTDSSECINDARFVGRWFATAGSPHTVLTLWGVMS